MAITRVTINLPEEQVKFLKDIAKREHITVTDVLRRAINSEKFFVSQEEKGKKILVEGDGQNLMEIIRR